MPLLSQYKTSKQTTSSDLLTLYLPQHIECKTLTKWCAFSFKKNAHTTCQGHFFLRYGGIFVLFFIFKIQNVKAQNADSLLNIAQILAHKGRYDTAIVIMDKLCAQAPRNTDFRLLRARVHAWNRTYDRAENDAQAVLGQNPRNREAMTVLADIYLWSNNWNGLEKVTKKALEVQPASSVMAQLEGGNAVTDSAVFIKKYALGLIEQNRLKEALSAMKPVKEQLPELYESTQLRKMPHMIGWHGSYFHYVNSNQKDWKLTDIEYTYKSRRLTMVGTVNYASRFGSQGVQYMAQAYPRISNKAYGWLIAGFSDGKAFPDRAWGASFFLNVAKGWEAELGIRLFQVLKNKETATVLRGGLARQWGSNRLHYGIARISGSAQGLTHSLNYRRYFKDGFSYWQAGIGTGASTQSVLSPNFDDFIINSRAAHFMINKWVSKQMRLFCSSAWEQSENRIDDKWQSRWILDCGIGYRF